MVKGSKRLSIIIATKNRSDKIIFCIRKLLDQIIKNEIIIVDQSDNSKTEDLIAKFKSNRIIYFKKNLRGKSAALNFGLEYAKGDILAFTDDDCIVSNNWIIETLSTFEKYPDISCVTGNVYPYGNIPRWACPPTLSTDYKVYSKPEYHINIGFGNNFAIRKSVIDSIGVFKTWLGPGSLTSACEDGDMLLRILIHGYKILHNPNIVIYHNKYVTKSQLKRQYLIYISGEIACYGYYLFSGHKFAQNIIKFNFINSYYDIKRIIGDLIKRRILNIVDWKYLISKIFIQLKGIFIGYYYFIKDTV